MATTFQTVIAEFYRSFESFKRDGSPERCFRIKSDAFEWLQGYTVMLAIHSALDDRSPDDWVYKTARAILSCLESYAPYDACKATDDMAHEICDSLVDVYNAARCTWLASHPYNMGLCDEAREEFGADDNDDTCTRIGQGQYMAIHRLYGAVVEACASEADARDEAE